MKIQTHRPENVKMQEFLRANGFPNAVPWYIDKGSMRGCWRIYSKQGKGFQNMDKWTMEIADKLTALGFKGFDGGTLGQFSGNGGMFHTFVRGHYEFLS